MSFVDTYTFKASAGKGGDGVVRWRREKFIPKGGPAGGNGGKGGDIYVRCVRDIMKIGRIAHIDTYTAQDGDAGGGNSCAGKNGKDLIIDLPIGSVIKNIETGHAFELLEENQEIQILRGGEGGRGNESFKSSSNQSPRECTKGVLGERAVFTVELKIIADVGLVGLPNAGKSSLLNAFSNARVKVGAYPFTTISPNLGTCAGIVIADIPGIIEGAHEGKGLGREFLRHISRTGVILHCISLEQDDTVLAYRTVRTELEGFDDGILSTKKEMVVFTKIDLISKDELHKKITLFEEKTNIRVFASVSIVDPESLKALQVVFQNIYLESK